MSEAVPTTLPVLERIAQHLLTATKSIKKAAGYYGDGVVTRESGNPTSPGDWQIIMSQGPPETDDEGPALNAEQQVAWLQSFVFYGYVRETSSASLDQQMNLLWCDIVRAVMADTTCGGLASRRIYFEPPLFINDDDGVNCVVVPLVVPYRTSTRDPRRII